MSEKTQNVICIIGMHRSGTSMVTRLLNACGLELGASEQIYLDSREDNEEGHFEHKGFHKINESLLAHFDGAWDNPPTLETDWEYDPTLQKITRRAKKLLKTFAPYSHWGWKDPRTTLLLPFWTSLVSNLRFVICVRNPLEVAQSLARRDRMPLQAGGYLWQQYMQAALRDTTGYPRLITFYEDFFKDPTHEAKRLIEFCGLPDFDPATISEVVAPKLKHHTVDAAALLNEDKLLNKPKLFYLALRTLATEGTEDRLPTDSLSQILSLFDQTPDEQTDLINGLQAQLQKQHHATRLYAEQSAQLETMGQEVADLQAVLHEKEADLQRQQQTAQAAQEQVGQLAAERDTLAQTITTLQSKIQMKDDEIRQSQQTVQDTKKQVSELVTERAVMQQEMASLHQTLQQRDADIQQHQQLAREAKERTAELVTERTAMQQEMAGLHRGLQQKEAEISRLNAEQNSLQQKSSRHQETLSQRESELRELEIAYSDTQRQLNAIFASRGYKPLATYWHVADRLTPLGSRRRRIAEWVMGVPRLLTWQNLSSLFKQVRLYGLVATYRGASDKVKDEVSGQVNIIQPRPQLTADNGHFSTTQATVSVVIPVKNAGPEFRQTLDRLTQQQGVAEIELIIVDSGSTDQSQAIAAEFGATVIPIPPQEFSHANARNIGAERASGDYLLFTVQDALPPSETWLASLLHTLQQEEVVAVSCTETPREDADLFYRAGTWQYSRFMAVDKYDRIMSYPERENHLTLRKNSALSNIACLIARDTFLRYKFRGAYAEDLDLGLRLIRDGHQLALLGSSRIIHSHKRPPVAHLKRGYVDELTLAEILPDRPVLERDVSQLFSDLVFVFGVIQAVTDEALPAVQTPCKPKALSTAVLKKFQAMSKAAYPDRIDLTGNPYLSGPFQSFMQTVVAHYQADGLTTGRYNGSLLERLQAYTMLIIDYLNHNYEMIDGEALEDFKYSLYKAYAFLSGTYLASCYKNGDHQAKGILEPFTHWLTEEGDRLLNAAPNGAYRNGQSPKITMTPANPPDTPHQHRARLIALYLPQFHPIPENNEWWGEGFTEWTNVSKAEPLFAGHYQPHLPADLGFYDLRLPEARLAQANLARQYGIEGFCYYHYWFNGRRLLDKPFNDVLASGQPDFPFCLAWANETWSRRWLGEEKAILMKQDYSPEDDLNHARWLVNAFADPRHIRVRGRPLYLIYRPAHMPDAQRSTDILRETCVKHGLPNPFLLGINAHAPDVDYRKLGFDGTMNFEPWLGALPDVMDDSLSQAKLTRNLKFGVDSKKFKIYDYVEARRKMLNHKKKHPTYPCIFVSWDNSPRRGEHGIVMVNSGPDKFETGLADMVGSVQHKPYDDRLVFINAWNEWAEGNHLEPDQKHGRGYLEAVRRVNVINSR